MKRKKNWLTRLIISYMPVYLLSTSAIIIFLFFSIVRSARNDLTAANRALVTQIRYNIDDVLNRVERSAVKSLYLSKEISAGMALYDSKDQNPYYSRYRMFQEIQNYLIENSDVSSVYLYIQKPRVVISSLGLFPLDEFFDRDFIEASASSVSLAKWSGLRECANAPDPQASGPVVSLVRAVSDTGLIVVNVPTYKLEQAIAGLNSAGIHFADVTDAEGRRLLSVRLDLPQARASAVLSTERTRSGWLIQGGLEQSRMLSVVEISSIVWIAVSILLTLLGAVSIQRQSKRNYAPLEAIVNDIRQMGEIQPGLTDSSENEFHLISRTIRTFSDIVGDYQNSKRMRDILLGKADVPAGAEGGKTCTVLILELDKRAAAQPDLLDTCDAIQSHIVERWMKEGDGAPTVAWLGWMSYTRLAVVVQDTPMDKLLDTARRLTAWISGPCRSGAVAGVGRETRLLSGLAASYQQASEALQHKNVCRSGDVIPYQDAYSQTHSPDGNAIQAIRAISDAFQGLNPKWEAAFGDWNDQMAEKALSNAEVDRQYRLLLEMLGEFVLRQSAATQSIWKNLVYPNLTAVLEQSDFLSDIRQGFLSGMSALYEQYAALKSRKQENQTLTSIQSLIDGHYTDPEFSLGWIAEKLKMNPNYISTLIKDGTGTSFTRIVNQKRAARAQELLLGTNLQISAIAAEVGFQSAISFHRVFKQIVGMTPGDYRKSAQP